MFIRVIQYLIPDSLNLDESIRDAFEEGRIGFQNLAKKGIDGNSEATEAASKGSDGHSAGEIFLFWWQIFMLTLLAVFFLSCVSHFAQHYQLTIDQEESNKLRKRLLTPTSSVVSSGSKVHSSAATRGKLSSLMSPTSATSSLLLPVQERDRERDSRDRDRERGNLLASSSIEISKDAQPKTIDLISESDSKKRE